MIRMKGQVKRLERTEYRVDFRKMGQISGMKEKTTSAKPQSKVFQKEGITSMKTEV